MTSTRCNTFFALLGAFASLSAPAWAEREDYPELQPTTYRSQSGEFELFVDPSARDGSGKATYRLSKKSEVLWTTDHEFTLRHAVVCDDGVAAGFGYGRGLTIYPREKGDDFLVAVLAADGAVRRVHATPRRSSRFLHGSAKPLGVGILLQEDRDRFVVRVADEFEAAEDRADEAEFWWPFHISTGDALPRFRPEASQPDAELHSWTMGVVAIRGAPLILVQWYRMEYQPSGAYRYGTRYAVLDETDAPIWSLDLPEDYSNENEDEFYALRRKIEAREQGGILRWDEPRRFDLELVRDARRVTYEVSGSAGAWIVNEVARVETEKRAAEPDVPKASVPEPAVEPLSLLGVIDLEIAKTPAPFVRDVHGFAFDGEGNVAFLRFQKGACTFAYADPRGAKIAEHALPALDGERGSYLGDLAWIGEGRFVVGWDAYSSSHPDAAKVFVVAARSGECAQIVGDIGYKLDGLASAGDGQFIALGDNRLDAFDREGRRLWKLQGSDGLCGAQGVAVLQDGRIVVHDSEGVQWIKKNGKLGSYDPIEKLWSREPRYLCGIEADLDGGVIVEDAGVPVRMDAGGALVGELEPRFADGRRMKVVGALRAGPRERRWMSDVYSILGVRDDGIVDVVLGEDQQTQRLWEAAVVCLDREDRIYAASTRTGAVHVFDPAGKLLRVLQPAPGDFDEELSFASASLTVDDGLDVYLRDGSPFVRWNSAGERVGTAAVGKDSIGESWHAQPGTKNRFVHRYAKATALVGPDGAVLARLERKPSGHWMSGGSASLARDGSIAFLSSRDEPDAEHELEAVIFAADGAPLAQVPLRTYGTYPQNIAYDGKVVAVLVNGRLQVRDVKSSEARLFELPGMDAETTYHVPVFPRTRNEIWVFDNRHSVRRYAFPRG